MKDIMVEKVTLNIGTGEPGEKLERAMKLLKTITDNKAVQTKAKRRIPTWGVRPGLAIGCKVTLRKKKADEVLKRLLSAVDNKLSKDNFDKNGNLSFGIKEYISIPNVNYDGEIGIIGLEAAVTLMRFGFRVKRRLLKRKKVGKKHIISKEEAIKFMEKNFEVEVR